MPESTLCGNCGAPITERPAPLWKSPALPAVRLDPPELPSRGDDGVHSLWNRQLVATPRRSRSVQHLRGIRGNRRTGYTNARPARRTGTKTSIWPRAETHASASASSFAAFSWLGRQRGVVLAEPEQLIVRARFHQLAAGHYEHVVSIVRDEEPVGDRDDRHFSSQRLECGRNAASFAGSIAAVASSRMRTRGPADQRGRRETLSFAPREGAAGLAAPRRQPLRQGLNDTDQLRRGGGRRHLVVGRLKPAGADILGQRVVEDEDVLVDDRDLLAQAPTARRRDVDPVPQYPPSLRVMQA